MAKVFNTLDRQQLMLDLCQMMADAGYKIMAGILYDELVRQNILEKIEYEEYVQLVKEHTLSSF